MSSAKVSLSRIVDVTALPAEGSTVSLNTTPAERDALAAANGLVALGSLRAVFHLVPELGAAVHVTGRIEAAVTQTCVVTLDAFETAVDEPVDLRFMGATEAEAWARRHRLAQTDEPGLSDADPPDVIVDGKIDLGALASEYLALGIDPYPRKPGAFFESAETDKDPSPFSVLSSLKPHP